jgi:hypothetical protein
MPIIAGGVIGADGASVRHGPSSEMTGSTSFGQFIWISQKPPIDCSVPPRSWFAPVCDRPTTQGSHPALQLCGVRIPRRTSHDSNGDMSEFWQNSGFAAYH